MDSKRAVKTLRDAGLMEEAAWAATWIPSSDEWSTFLGESGERSIAGPIGSENDEEHYRRVGPLFFAERRLRETEDEREGEIAAEVAAIEMHLLLGTHLPRDPDDESEHPVAVVVVPPRMKADYPLHVEFHDESGLVPLLIHPDAIGLVKPHAERPDLTILRLIDEEETTVVRGSYAETKRKLGFEEDADDETEA